LFLLLLRPYHHLHPIAQAKSSFVENINEDSSLDIFDTIASASELVKELVN
jgi:hypothetical protein